MPAIVGDPIEFLKARAAVACAPLPAKGPKQRGPSCGFYALGHVLQYWHLKFAQPEQEPMQEQAPAPLPARTHMEGPKPEPYKPEAREARDRNAAAGRFTSLRQLGKFLQVTAYGSVFNAENLVRVARHASLAGRAGSYDGHVIDTTSADDYVDHIVQLIANECPVIVPFDAQAGTGDPINEHGNKAHWAVIFGHYAEGPTRHFVHYHWGEYRHSPASAFATSTRGLTANALRPMQKADITHPKLTVRSHLLVSKLEEYRSEQWAKHGLVVRTVGDAKPNVEFTNPAALLPHDPLLASADLLRLHGFDPANLTNAGLKDKLVAIYPQRLKAQLGAL